MIQNKKIIEKLDEKTSGDDVMKSFIMDIFERESEGKHFQNYYREQISKKSKERF